MIPDDPLLANLCVIWRFTDAEKYCQFTKEKFDRLRPLTEKESLKKWAEFVHPASDRLSRHLVQLFVRGRIEYPEAPTFQSVTNAEEARVPTNLRRYLPAEDSTDALFFWHGTEAVWTDFGLFLEHWSDFCYPSDESNVLVIPELSKAVWYREDNWFVLERGDGQEFFPLRNS